VTVVSFKQKNILPTISSGINYFSLNTREAIGNQMKNKKHDNTIKIHDTNIASDSKYSSAPRKKNFSTMTGKHLIP
jgi:hypothetical protein